jgi:hypothetical protein
MVINSKTLPSLTHLALKESSVKKEKGPLIKQRAF